jgi:maleylpyruvate isomerase
MYAADDVRDADIAAGCRRSAASLVADVQESAAVLAPLLARLGPEQVGRIAERTPGGRSIAAQDVRYLRLRELVYHHVDLNAGFTFEHLSPELLALFLDETVTNLHRHPQAPGLTIRDRGQHPHRRRRRDARIRHAGSRARLACSRAD